MPNRLEWIEIIIVGLVGGVAAACLGLAFRFGASVDNLLNFFGSAVGSGLAVVAALWLESHRRQRALEKMVTSLVISASVAMRFKSIESSLIRPLILTFQQSSEAFEASRLGVNIQDPLHQYALQSAIFWMKRAVEDMHNGVLDCESGKITEARLLELSRKQAAGIIGSIEDFINQPRVPKTPVLLFRKFKAVWTTSP